MGYSDILAEETAVRHFMKLILLSVFGLIEIVALLFVLIIRYHFHNFSLLTDRRGALLLNIFIAGNIVLFLFTLLFWLRIPSFPSLFQSFTP